MMIFYDFDLNNLLINSNKNKRNLNQKDDIDLKYIDENETSCFVKIQFYENGEIKNIFLPTIFSSSNMIYINNIIKLIIPKLSPNLFVDNINDILIELNISTDDYDNADDSDEEKKIKEDINRILDEELYNNSNINNSDCLEYEDIISDKYYESNNVDLRQADIEENQNENKEFKKSNLTQYSLKSLETEQISLKDSELNTIIYSTIDENGFLTTIKEIQKAIMNQPNDENSIDKEDEDFKNQIYSNNQISRDDANFEDNFINNLNTNLTKIIMDGIDDIYLDNKINDEKIISNLFKYFDDFNYSIYNETNENENNRRILSEEIELEEKNNKNSSELKYYIKNYLNNLKKSKLRNLEDKEIENYGMKKFTFEKEFFKYNILGLKIEGKSICETEPSTGVVSISFNICFSKFCKKFKLANQQTNLHIIIDRMNKMTFNFITLLSKSNNELVTNNKKYGDIILEIEKNTSILFHEYFDYSGIFIDSLNDLYYQVSVFISKYFKELIILIDETYKNYTYILNQSQNNSYDSLNEIRIVTVNAYKQYINNMIDYIEIFQNETILFLENIENEAKSIDIFQIDYLYDIIDLIYDGKLVIKEFSKNLFKDIDKGIITFKYDIKDYIENIIGDLIYITDFLSININKNEIM